MSSIIRERHQPISAQSSASSSIDGGYSSTTPSSYPHTDHNNNQHQQQNSSLSSSSSSTSSACDQQQYCHLFSETNHNRRRHHHHHFHHHHHHPHSGLIGHIGFGMAGIDSGNNHGIGDCNPNPRNYCKLLFKITIVLLSFAGFLYQATDICAHYFSYRTVVYTNTEQDSLVDLPSITFCLPTYFTKQSLEQLYSPYIKRNLEEMSAFKNQSMLDAIKPVIYETFQVIFILIITQIIDLYNDNYHYRNKHSKILVQLKFLMVRFRMMALLNVDYFIHRNIGPI